MLVTLPPIYTCGLPHSTAHLKTFTGSASRQRGLKKYKASTIHFHQFVHLDYPSIPISNPLSFIPLSAQRKSQPQVLTHSCHHIDMLDLFKDTQLSFIRGSASSQHAYIYAFDTYRSLTPILSDCVPSCNKHTHTNPSDITMTCWHRLAPFVTQQSIIIYSLTINHPSDSISTIIIPWCATRVEQAAGSHTSMS